jgi:hypothetical protein
MVSFDPSETAIDPELRARIEEWATEVPKLQSSQYGPINKYLNFKFKRGMVKPQALIRPILPEEAAVGDEGADGLEDLGNVSMDSTGNLMVNSLPSSLITH